MNMKNVIKIGLVACGLMCLVCIALKIHSPVTRALISEPLVREDRNGSDLILPVHPDDVSHMKLSSLKSNWLKPISFIEYDIKKRPIDFKCKNIRKQGNWPICQDGKYLVKPPCLVYSFGIANEFSFDDAMARLGCEVHSFDPSMGVSDHVRNSSVRFHAIGLGGQNIENFEARRDIYVRKKQLWTLMTLGTIMAALGHKDRYLDVLKIDIETHEWNVTEYLLNSGALKKIKQLVLEYHIFENWPPKSDFPKLLKTYKKLHDSGFEKFYTYLHPGVNHNPKTFNLQVDIGYVNTAI